VSQNPVIVPSEEALPETGREDLRLEWLPGGLTLVGDGLDLRGDFHAMLPRIRQVNLQNEYLVKAAKPASFGDDSLAIDATAGLGEDSLLLAAAGFRVRLYERNAVIAALLQDALRRAADEPELAPIVARMEVVEADSTAALTNLDVQPDLVLLDPMFPERRKSAISKKKMQLFQKLEAPCDDEAELLDAAFAAKPRKVIVKRPPKGPFLAGRKPSYSLTGKAVRYDCYVLPR
jgi:16S rRNA (guanine1516-N2)-methyltransferase